MTLQELQPYLTVVSAVLSITALGFILRLLKAVRDNANAIIAEKEERVKRVLEDSARLKEWSEREKAELKDKLQETNLQLDSLLKKEGIDSSTLVAGKRLSESAVDFQDTVKKLTAEMQETIVKLTDLGDNTTETQTAGARKTIAMVEMASGRYDIAADQYDSYAAMGSASWEDHLSRGVSHANAQKGKSSDMAALLAYNDAIAVAPDNLEKNKRARLFTYRAAMLKRLGRLTEAENDLMISSKLATEEYEHLDAYYNLACVYALQGRGEKMYAALANLQGSQRFISGVACHIHDYFSQFKTDQRFLEILEQ